MSRKDDARVAGHFAPSATTTMRSSILTLASSLILLSSSPSAAAHVHADVGPNDAVFGLAAENTCTDENGGACTETTSYPTRTGADRGVPTIDHHRAPPPEEETMVGAPDGNNYCAHEAKSDMCGDWAGLMSRHCKGGYPEERFGARQLIEGEEAANTAERLQNVIRYMEEKVLVDEEFEYIREKCRNYDERCTFWATQDECKNMFDFMLDTCSPACFSCHLLDIKLNCPRTDSDDALGPGGLHRMFERIVDPHNVDVALYKPVVHSRPAPEGDDDDDSKSGPWVVSLENFMTDEECDRLIELGFDQGYKRSTVDDGPYDIASEIRTSENAWCYGECYQDAVTQRVIDRMATVTSLPQLGNNIESLQILRYGVGKRYDVHHDYLDESAHTPCGPRILTFFLYLSDVEKGGETHFPHLLSADADGLKITPRKGMALLWPSVTDDDPSAIDIRTEHAALPVGSGLKYAANAWIHLRDYQHQSADGCC